LKSINKRKNYLSDAISLKGKVVCFNIKYHVLYASANFETPCIWKDDFVEIFNPPNLLYVSVNTIKKLLKIKKFQRKKIGH